MPKLTVKSNQAVIQFARGVAANLEPGDAFLNDVGEEIIASIHRNIESQKQANGAPLERNAKSTRERKRDAGRPQLSLVDEFKRFITVGKGWRIKLRQKKSVTVFPLQFKGLGSGKGTKSKGRRPGLKSLVQWVQEMGYVGWFGLDKAGIKNISRAWRKEVKRLLKDIKRNVDDG